MPPDTKNSQNSLLPKNEPLKTIRPKKNSFADNRFNPD